MTNTETRIVTHANVDCDGIAYSWHRVYVPVGTPDDEIYPHAVQTGQMSSYYDGSYPLSRVDAKRFVNHLACESRSVWNYWRNHGYASKFRGEFR